MSTMFSAPGGSSAPTAGGSPAGSPASAGSPGANTAAGTPTGQPGAVPGTPPGQQGASAPQGGQPEPFFREKVKVNGKEEEISFATREELAAYVRKARAADQRFEEGHRAKKEAERIAAQAQKAREEADKIRAKYGDDALSAAFDQAIESGDPERIKRVRQAMEQRLAMLVRQDMMDPKERELEQERRARKAAEDKLKSKEEQDEKAALEKETAHWRTEFTNTIIGALETGKVPNTDWTASIMAKLMTITRQKGYKLSPEQLAEKTRTVIMNQVSGLLGAAAGEQLIEWFPDLVKKIRAADLKRLRGGKQPPVPAGKKPLEVAPPPAQPAEPPRYMTPDEWRKWVKENAAKAQAERGVG